MQNSVPKIIFIHTSYQASICISTRLAKETVREQGQEMEDFGACDRVLQRDLTGELCMLSGYHKGQVSRGGPKWGTGLQ